MTRSYLVAVVLASEDGGRIGEEYVEVDAYDVVEATTQAAVEVSARNSATERGLVVRVAWIGPTVLGARARAEQAVACVWLSRQAVVTERGM